MSSEMPLHVTISWNENKLCLHICIHAFIVIFRLIFLKIHKFWDFCHILKLSVSTFFKIHERRIVVRVNTNRMIYWVLRHVVNSSTKIGFERSHCSHIEYSKMLCHHVWQLRDSRFINRQQVCSIQSIYPQKSVNYVMLQTKAFERK